MTFEEIIREYFKNKSIYWNKGLAVTGEINKNKVAHDLFLIKQKGEEVIVEGEVFITIPTDPMDQDTTDIMIGIKILLK